MGRGSIAPIDFGRSDNPILTRGRQIMPTTLIPTNPILKPPNDPGKYAQKRTSFDVVPNGFYRAYKNSLEVNHKKKLKIEPAESSSLKLNYCS